MKEWLRILTVTLWVACLCAAQTATQTPSTPAPADSEGPKPDVPVLVPPAPQAETPKPTQPSAAPVRQAQPTPPQQTTAQQALAQQAPGVTAPATPPGGSGAPKDPAFEPPPQKKPSVADAAGPMPKSAVKEGADGKPYVIGSLDVLYVRVWGNANLTGMVDVRTDGMISLALIGELRADGLTVQQLTEQLKIKLTDFLNSPEVDVQVTKINSKKFVITGRVGRAGEFPLIGKTTIFEALANAGLRDDANLKKIYLLRGTKKYFFNYKDVSEGKNLDKDIPIENGDRIFVP